MIRSALLPLVLLAALLTGCATPGSFGGLPFTGSETFTADDALLDAQYMKWWQGRPVTQADVEAVTRMTPERW